jgi:RNA polymerase sigma-70 factor (ECF subfamily)
MSEPSVNTLLINDLVNRCQTGDRIARDELVGKVIHRLERMAQRMMRKFPNVARHVEWQEVVSEATMKLLHALEKRSPQNTREFFNLAAAILRNHLIDLARHFKQILAREVHLEAGENSSAGDPIGQLADPNAEGDDLDRWAAFHKAVETLPAEEREIFSLVFYHDWPYADIAEMFNCATRTVQRRYKEAILSLRQKLGSDMNRLLTN